jgi:phosphate/sulfate permease
MTDTKVRCGGGLLVLLGLFLIYLTVWRPIQAAQAHAADVSLNTKGAAFAPAGVILGGIVIAMGRQARETLSRDTGDGRRKLQPAGWVVVAVCLALGIGLYLWTKSVIEGYGYHF